MGCARFVVEGRRECGRREQGWSKREKKKDTAVNNTGYIDSRTRSSGKPLNDRLTFFFYVANVTGHSSNQDPLYRQKPIYSRIFTRDIWF